MLSRFNINKRILKFRSFKFYSTLSKDPLSDILPDSFMYKIPQYKKNPKNFNFPFLVSGAPNLEIKTRFLPDQVLVRNDITRKELLLYLFKLYRGVLLAISQYDYDFLREYCEENFYSKLFNVLSQYKDSNYTIEVLEDMKANNNVRLYPELHLYDSIIIKGLSNVRSQNGSEKDYQVCDDIEEMGFISYIHNDISNSGNFLTRELGEKNLENLNFKNLIFRTYCMFKSGLKVFIKKDGKDIVEYNSNYTYNHVVVFETLMQDLTPLKSFSKMETYTEWISKHNFGTWRLIDMDNWLNGNNYFNS